MTRLLIKSLSAFGGVLIGILITSVATELVLKIPNDPTIRALVCLIFGGVFWRLPYRKSKTN
jgi:hypothetical protein